MKKSLLNKIEKNNEVVGIIGLGYVGLPLAVEFAKNNVSVIGFDVSSEKIDNLKKGLNYIDDIEEEDFKNAISKKFNFTSDFSNLNICDAIIICVPTPLDKF